MPTHNEKLLEINARIAEQLIDNNKCLDSGWKRADRYVLLSNRELFIELQPLMKQLEEELFEGAKNEKSQTEVSNRDTCKNDDTEGGNESTHSPWACSFSC